MENSLQEYLDTAKNLLKLKKYYESLDIYEEILKEAYKEKYENNFFDIFDEALNQIRIIAAKLNYQGAEELSTLYDEFLMKNSSINSFPDKKEREKRVKNQYISAANDFIIHINNIKEKINQPKNASTPLIIGFAVGAVAAAAATAFFFVRNRK